MLSVHRRRNVVDHLPEEHKSVVKKKLQNAYAMSEYADPKRALGRLHRELMELNPNAVRRLEEGRRRSRFIICGCRPSYVARWRART